MFFLLGPEDALTFLYCIWEHCNIEPRFIQFHSCIVDNCEHPTAFGQEDPAKSERHSVVPVLGDDIYWALDVPVATR